LEYNLSLLGFMQEVGS